MESIDLSEGIVVVVGDVPKAFEFNPKVVGLDPTLLGPGLVEGRLPKSAKIVVLGTRLPSLAFTSLKEVCEKRKISYLTRTSPEAVLATLKDLTPTPKNGKKDETVKRPHGFLSKFVEEFFQTAKKEDLSRGVADLGREVFKLAQAANLQTTVGSVTQAVMVWKKKHGRGDVPKSLQSRQQQALTILDSAIESLQLIRIYVADTETKNSKLEGKVAKLLAALKDD